MFPGFTLDYVAVSDDVTLRVRHGGDGPPVVLLHGHPRRHTTWHRVAPLLIAAGHTVVCPDLRGYGQSSKPEPDAEHRVYCDRAMAGDVVRLMSELGHEGSPSSATTAAAMSPTGPLSITPTASSGLPCSTAFLWPRPSSGPTPGLPSSGGTGSSSPPTRRTRHHR